MKLYHGSNKLYTYLDGGKSKKDNDFGKGLYFTTNFNQALKWVNKKGKGNGYIYEIDIDLSNPSLNIISYKDEDLKEILYLCRNETEEVAEDEIEGFKEADIIYGNMLRCIKEFKENLKEFHGEDIGILDNNKIVAIEYNVDSSINTLEDLEKTMRLFDSDDNDQYCFKSIKAEQLANKSIKIIHHVKNKKVCDKFKALFDDNKNEFCIVNDSRHNE